MDIPLDTSIDQYDDSADERNQIETLTLQSSEVVAQTAYMVNKLNVSEADLLTCVSIFIVAYQMIDLAHIESCLKLVFFLSDWAGKRKESPLVPC